MKFFRYITISAVLVFGLSSCKKENENQWDVEIKNPVKKVEITDLSGEFYDSKVSLEDFKAKYPWFQGSVPDADYDNRRKDTMEVRIYKEAISKIDKTKFDSYTHFPDRSKISSRILWL